MDQLSCRSPRNRGRQGIGSSFSPDHRANVICSWPCYAHSPASARTLSAIHQRRGGVPTSEGSWMVPAGHGLLIPAGAEHHVRMMGDVALQTLDIDRCLAAGLGEKCFVIAVSPLLQSLIEAASDRGPDSEFNARGGNCRASFARGSVSPTPAAFATAALRSSALGTMCRFSSAAEHYRYSRTLEFRPEHEPTIIHEKVQERDRPEFCQLAPACMLDHCNSTAGSRRYGEKGCIVIGL